MSRLRIVRHTARYAIPRGSSQTAAIRAHMDGAMRGRAAEGIARAFGASDDDPRVILIRHLSVRVTVAADWSEGAIAEAWSAGVAKTLRRTLNDVPDGVMIFADRAAYLKEFAIDRAAGRAHGRWYYRAFDGLAALPTSGAIRTALLDVPADGETALLRMSAPTRQAVLRAMTEADAGRVFLGLWEPAGLPSAELLTQALEAVEGGSRSAMLGAYLRLREASPEEAGGLHGEAAQIAAAFVGATGRVGSVAHLIEAIGRDDLATLVRLTDVDVGQALCRLVTVPAETLRRAAGHGGEAASSPLRRATPYGGAFLLLEPLAELPLEAWCADWPPFEGLAAAQAVRWTLLLQALGTARSGGAARDPVLRDLFALPPGFDLAHWGRTIREPRLAALRAELQGWQTTKGFLSGRTVAVAGRWIDDARGMYVERPEPFAGEIDPDVVARLEYAASDARYLRPASGTGVSRRLADGLAPLAMAVVRGFAWRLPGFGRSHLEHLSRNFLACAATTVREDDALVATLTRPPLDLVLRMTRIARPSIVLPWTDPPSTSIDL